MNGKHTRHIALDFERKLDSVLTLYAANICLSLLAIHSFLQGVLLREYTGLYKT